MVVIHSSFVSISFHVTFYSFMGDIHSRVIELCSCVACVPLNCCSNTFSLLPCYETDYFRRLSEQRREIEHGDE